MRSLLARLAVLGALAVSLSACGGGNGTSLPFAGGPNQAGGTAGTIQTGSNGEALIRFIQGSPDVITVANPTGTVDVCIDNLSLGIIGGSAKYAGAATSTANSGTLVAVAGGIPHTVAVYTTLTGGAGNTPGSECATAPGPFFGQSAIGVTTISPGNNVRQTIVLGGTAASHTLGLYVFAEPSFIVTPVGSEAISHNAAPAFSIGKANGVGFGTCTTTVTPCAVATALTGAQGVAVAKVSTAGAAVSNTPVTSALATNPPGFYDGIGVAAGTPVPITAVPAPAPPAGQPFIIDLYAIDGPAGGLNLVAVVEQTLGFGF